MEIENTSQDQPQPVESSQNTKKTRSKKSAPPKEEEKEEKPKKEKTPKKEKAPKKEKTPKKEKSETKESEKKGKRGYKICKNPSCEDYVHIHNKVCPKCGYEFELKNNVKPIPEDPEEFEQMLKKKKTKREGKAGQEAAEIVAEEETTGIPDMRIIKKGFYRNAYTVNYAKLIKNMQSLKERVFPEYNLAAEVSYKDMEFPKMNTFQISLHAKENNVTSFELPFSKTQDVDFDVKKPWKEVLINAGYPINSVAWAYRGKNNAEENINRDQYFAVSHSSANINKIKTDENTYITLQALNIQNFHKFGTKYDNEEYIAFYQIKWNDQTSSYDLPKLMFYMEHKGGSCLEMKWLPISSSSIKEIGILAILTANGTVSIFSIPCIESPNPLEQAVKLNPLEEISLPNVYFTQLAWCPQAPCDKLLIGDIVGNIYLFHVSIQNSKSSSKWIKLYQMAHTKDIKDLRWLPSYGEGEEVLFASCSEDGDTKIWSLEDNCTPLHTFSPTKRPVYSILWDIGATYLMTNGEGPSLSTKMISFQNLKNYMKTGKEEKKIEDLIENVELKYVTSFETTLKSTNSAYSPYLVSADIQGSMIFYNSEELRQNLIYGNKRDRNDEIEVISKSHLEEKDGEKIVTIKYKQEKKKQAAQSNKNEEKALPDSKIAISSLELNPNNLQEGLTGDKQVVSMLLVGNYLGLLRVLYFYK